MAREALSLVEVEGGIVHCFESGMLGPLRLERCGHPLPVAEAAEQGGRMLDFARSLGADDDVLVLLSGGASAMLEAPVAGIQLDELRQTTEVLLKSGANIGEINTIRRCLSRTKGGRLLEALHPARVFNLIISDVPGQPPSVVSSGPTLPPAGGRAEDVVARYGLQEDLPDSVLTALRANSGRAWKEPEGLRLRTLVVADNDSAVEALVAAGMRMGLDLKRAPTSVVGEAREAAIAFQREAVSLEGDGYVGGGECIVTVRGEGRGGRAQEFVLAAAGAASVGLVAALGTDGIDGMSAAAGALCDEHALAACGEDFTPGAYLDHNDSDGFFSRVGTQLITGRTGTNVSDIYLFLR